MVLVKLASEGVVWSMDGIGGHRSSPFPFRLAFICFSRFRRGAGAQGEGRIMPWILLNKGYQGVFCVLSHSHQEDSIKLFLFFILSPQNFFMQSQVPNTDYDFFNCCPIPILLPQFTH